MLFTVVNQEIPMTSYKFTQEDYKVVEEHVRKAINEYKDYRQRTLTQKTKDITQGKLGEIAYFHLMKDLIKCNYFHQKKGHDFLLVDGTKVDVKTITTGDNRVFFKMDSWHDFDRLDCVVINGDTAYILGTISRADVLKYKRRYYTTETFIYKNNLIRG